MEILEGVEAWVSRSMVFAIGDLQGRESMVLYAKSFFNLRTVFFWGVQGRGGVGGWVGGLVGWWVRMWIGT